MVKRYNIEATSWDESEMVERLTGDYVSFDDYEKCRKALFKFLDKS
jgi:hypothetical protein